MVKLSEDEIEDCQAMVGFYKAMLVHSLLKLRIPLESDIFMLGRIGDLFRLS